MKKIFLIALLSTSTMSAQADPAYMAGLSVNLHGGDFGITLKALSNDEEDTVVGALGATYYPFSKKTFGVDLGVGHNFKDATLTLGWDLLKSDVQIAAGVSDTAVKKSEPYIPPR